MMANIVFLVGYTMANIGVLFKTMGRYGIWSEDHGDNPVFHPFFERYFMYQ